MSNMLHEWIHLNTEGSAAVVEFGAMFFEKLHHVHPSVGRRFGIEIHLPYIQRADTAGCIIAHGDMRKFEDLIPEEDMDTALFVDTLEHLSREDAVDLIRRVQNKFRKILLFIPEGNHPQTTDVFRLGGDEYQTHRSTWWEKDVRELGFQTVVVAPLYHDEPGKDRGTIFAVWMHQ